MSKTWRTCYPLVYESTTCSCDWNWEPMPLCCEPAKPGGQPTECTVHNSRHDSNDASQPPILFPSPFHYNTFCGHPPGLRRCDSRRDAVFTQIPQEKPAELETAFLPTTKRQACRCSRLSPRPSCWPCIKACVLDHARMSCRQAPRCRGSQGSGTPPDVQLLRCFCCKAPKSSFLDSFAPSSRSKKNIPSRELSPIMQLLNSSCSCRTLPGKCPVKDL